MTGIITGGIKLIGSQESLRDVTNFVVFTGNEGSKLIDVIVMLLGQYRGLAAQAYAYECLLQYCVQAYNVSTVNGAYLKVPHGSTAWLCFE